MKANETSLLTLLNGAKQFSIPIFQRTYSWTSKQCTQLWKDIVRAASSEDVAGHFMGSIVYIQGDVFLAGWIAQLLVIDGQQRLATLSLLLSALGRAIEKSPISVDGISREQLEEDYLFNARRKGDLRYKLLLTQSDKLTLTNILDGRDLPDVASKRLVDNYKFFEEKIAHSGIDLLAIYRGICKLLIVEISLDSRYDNPQLIFESLNSTGLALSQADLIRNYVLMVRPTKEQEELYNDHWYPMEQSFGQANYAALFDRFMRDYLTIKTGRIPNINQVYEEFKLYAQGSGVGTVPEIVADIHKYSRYFVRMALEREPDKDLRAAFNDINSLKVDVAYPLMLELYNDYAEGRLSRQDLIQMLRLIESYVFRRAVCGIPTNSLNKTFATFGREIDKKQYLESFMAALLLKDSYRRFPDDNEFARELMVKDLYNFRSRNYWLRKLENHDRKEPVNVADYTIEHILPQNENLSEAWQKELGENWREVQARYLHTIGNLTLTGYNSPLSDRPFQEKRDMEGGFADSPIRLNKGLAKLDHWNETAIQARAEQLAQLAVQVWAYPQLDFAALAKYRKAKRAKTYMLTDHPYLAGPVHELFEQLRRRVLNLDASVTEEVLKYYIAYKTTTNFVDVVPQKRRLVLMLNMAFDQVYDPQGLCKDVSGVSKWGNGDVEVKLSSPDQLDYVMFLVQQSFQLHMEYGEG